MKALVTILFSLALVLSHWSAAAGPVRQLCQSAEPCGCGAAACCQVAPSSDQSPVRQSPAPDHSRTQLFAAVQAFARFIQPRPSATDARASLPIFLHSAPVPLFQRDCSYLI